MGKGKRWVSILGKVGLSFATIMAIFAIFVLASFPVAAACTIVNANVHGVCQGGFTPQCDDGEHMVATATLSPGCAGSGSISLMFSNGPCSLWWIFGCTGLTCFQDAPTAFGTACYGLTLSGTSAQYTPPSGPPSGMAVPSGTLEIASLPVPVFTTEKAVHTTPVVCGVDTLLDINVTGTIGGQRRPLDVMFVLDASGSMAARACPPGSVPQPWGPDKDVDCPIQNAKWAFDNIIDSLDPARDRIGLVSFHWRVDDLSGLTTNFAAVKSQIAFIKTDGGTMTHTALAHAEALILASPPRPVGMPQDAIQIIVLSSDGQICVVTGPSDPSCNSNPGDQATAEAEGIATVSDAFLNQGIITDVLELDTVGDANTAYNTQLIAAGGGTMRHWNAGLGGELMSALLQDLVGFPFGVIGTNVVLNDYLPPYIAVGTLPAQCTFTDRVPPAPDRVTCALGNLYAGITSSLTFMITTNKSGSNLANVYNDSSVDFQNLSGESQHLILPKAYIEGIGPCPYVDPCILSSVNISPDCAGGGSPDCEKGERIHIRAQYEGFCPNPLFLQVDALSIGTGVPCNITARNGNIHGMGLACTGSICEGDWTIPAVPAVCLGKDLQAGTAGAYNASRIDADHLVSNIPAEGSFSFANRTACPELTRVPDSAASAIFDFDGVTTLPQFADRIAMGDWNGDGYADALITAPRKKNGEASLFFGSSKGILVSGAANVTFIGKTANSYFGSSLAMGDWNGDGFDDVAIGAKEYGGVLARGRVLLFFGGARTGAITDTNADLVIRGTTNSMLFGSTVAFGDWNNDGRKDLLVAADNYSDSYGRAFLFLSNGQTGSFMDTAADVMFESTNPGQAFGRTLAFGDWNTDGYADVLIGAQEYNGGRGRAYLFFGDDAAGLRSDLGANATFQGTNFNINFSESLAFGDWNGDGKDDVILGTPVYTKNFGNTYGGVFIFFSSGKNEGNILPTTAANVSLYAVMTLTRFGESAAIGDMNGDGFGDVIVGAPGYGFNKGQVSVFFGRSFKGFMYESGANLTIDGKNTTERLGEALTLGDWNGDGNPDPLITAPTYGPPGPERGRAYLFTICIGCGNKVVEPGEECDDPDWGNIHGCSNFDDFDGGILVCNPPEAPEACFFNTENCTKTTIVPDLCGNGIIDVNETCDGDNWGPIDGCWWFDRFTSGNLSCIPRGEHAECHFNTSLCGYGIWPLPMLCGPVYYQKDNTILDTVACNDSLYGRVPITSEPQSTCPTNSSCVYLNELNASDPIPGCYYTGQNRTNVANRIIVCQGLVNNPVSGMDELVNTWCPYKFMYDVPSKTCIYTEDVVVDAGKMMAPWYATYQANCSVPVGLWQRDPSLNRQCFDPDSPLGFVDTAFPKNFSACLNFSVADYNDTDYPFRDYGFYTNTTVRIY